MMAMLAVNYLFGHAPVFISNLQLIPASPFDAGLYRISYFLLDVSYMTPLFFNLLFNSRFRQLSSTLFSFNWHTTESTVIPVASTAGRHWLQIRARGQSRVAEKSDLISGHLG
jgi:hypothetical protein